MSERKAINKYYPPDWDPSQVPKKEKNANPNAEKVRLMAPFSMKCLQCSEYISARRKFNARKEVTSEKYMDIKIIRFHIKCPRCNHTLSFQTDPKTAGFIPVSGCTRNYESLAATEPVKPLETEDEIFERLERQEKENQQFQEQQQRRKNNPFWSHKGSDSSKDAMANLEDKLIEQKREQETHDHLMYLQAKAAKLQQSGGADELVKRAQEKIRSDSKRDREDGHASETPPQSHVSEAKITPTVSGTFTVKKRKVDTRDAGHVMQNPPPSSSEKPASSGAVPSGVSVFGDYGSSDEE